LRQRLEQSDEQFPDQKGKLISRPTMRWVFQYFQGIDIVTLPGQPAAVFNRDGHHILVLQLLGSPYEQLYS
ncbi:MAG: IS4 family transposase, partial [Candidatus Competibacteraceae bacterium]|nr:IS4 family transposase [Candidatus Competibacteraceae bacterium]